LLVLHRPGFRPKQAARPKASDEDAMTAATTGPAGDAAEITARILLETKAVLFRPEQPFTFTSGRVSPVYVDCRRLISFPRARRRLMDLAADLIERRIGHESLDAVAGGETAGIPFAAWIAERLGLPMLYVRKQPKGFGRNAQIEGEMAEGARVILIEDLASEGSSKLTFVRAIRAAGGVIGHSFVIFNYGIFPQGVAALAAEGVTLHWLATWWDALGTAQALGHFTPERFAAIEAFLRDPDGWSARTGGHGDAPA
jgi:orotate phosphoribosyltransferase